MINFISRIELFHLVKNVRISNDDVDEKNFSIKKNKKLIFANTYNCCITAMAKADKASVY